MLNASYRLEINNKRVSNRKKAHLNGIGKYGFCKMGNVQSAQYMLEKLAELDCNKDRDDKEVYRIGDLAREFNVSLRTLRFYEDRGLISPERSGSTRLYSVDDRRRLKIILLIKNVGFSLIDIQEFLNLYDAGDGDRPTPCCHAIGAAQAGVVAGHGAREKKV